MNETTTIPQIKLNNGVRMPQLGLGMWQARAGGEVERAVLKALEVGFRSFDTAAIYDNEASLGTALRESGIPRDDVFIASKLWNDSHDYSNALLAFDTTLARLGVDYLDLYLIHWPVPRQHKFVDAWKALEHLFRAGLVRAIGVSNFKPHHLEELLLRATVTPAVNQIELHPKLQQRATQEFCRRHGITIEAYSPLMQGGEILRDPVIADIAEAHNKTPAQVVLHWHMQHDFITIPKSTNTKRTLSSNYQSGSAANTWFTVADRSNGWFQMNGLDLFFVKTRQGIDPNFKKVEVHSARMVNKYATGQNNSTYLSSANQNLGPFQVGTK